MAHVAGFEELMADVSAGSEEAIWQLAETYTPYILRAVRSSLPTKVRRKFDSQDFAQTLWASILLNRTDLTRLKTPEQLIAFLAKAARNKVIDASRRYLRTQKYDVSREQGLTEPSFAQRNAPRRTPADTLYTQDPTPSQFASVRERWTRIVAAASDRDRRILQMRFDGNSFDRISAKLEINQATARRAIQRLVEQLSE
jgi:RNA polymerase sigma factor (sigma-70 family)